MRTFGYAKIVSEKFAVTYSFSSSKRLFNRHRTATRWENSKAFCTQGECRMKFNGKHA